MSNWNGVNRRVRPQPRVQSVRMLALLAIAVFIPELTKFQERVFVVVLALAPGAVGGFLPGAIAVQGKRPSVAVRATGAIGFTVLVLLIYRWPA
jgi:hypothetical protein